MNPAHVFGFRVALTLLLLLGFTATCWTAESAPPVAQALPITPVGIVEGSLDLPGQRDRFKLDFPPGHRLLFDGLGPGVPLFAGLEDPDGWIRFSFNTVHDSAPCYPDILGADTLVVYAWGAETGDYRFRVLDLDEAEELPLGAAVSGLLDPPSMTQAYRFNANAGQRLRFESLAASEPSAGWSLLGSAEQVLQSSLIREDLGEMTLASSGTYWVLVQGWPDATQPLAYEIRVSVVSEPSGVASGFDEVHTVDLSSGGTKVFNYTAPAGTRVYLDEVGGDAAWLWADLRGPDGGVVFSVWALGDYGPVTLPFSGNYTLELRTDGGLSSGSQQFRLLDVGFGAVPLDFGVVIDRPLEPPRATEIYRFTGKPGQAVYVDTLGAMPDYVHFRVVGPSGQDAPGWRSVDDDYILTLAEAGIHYLLGRSGNPGNPTDLHFRLLDPAQSPTVLLPLDTPVSGWLSADRKADLFRIELRTGQRLFFDVPDGTTDISWNLFTPRHEHIRSESRDFGLVADESGVYTLGVSGWSSSGMDYDFEVVAAQSNSAVLELGAMTEAVLATRGEEASFQFTGRVGQRLFYDGIDTEIAELKTRLLGPDGSYVFYHWNPAEDRGPFTLALEGNYRLIFGGDTSRTGRFRFRVIELEGPSVMPLTFNQPIVDAFEPAGAAVVYSFPGVAGQRLFIDSQASDAAGGWTLLYSTEDIPCAAGSLSQESAVILPRSGAYLWVLSNWTPSQNTYALVVRTPESVTGAIEVGGLTRGSIAVPGDEHRYTFDGVPGMQVYYDALAAGLEDFTVRIIDPAEISMMDFDGTTDFGPLRLAKTGTYTVVVGGMGDAIGDYRFRLLELGAASEVPVYYSGRLDPGDETDLLGFAGAVGERVVLELRSTSASEANWRLLSPSGVVLAQQSSRYPLVADRLAEDGIYHVLIEGQGGGEPFDYQVLRTLVLPHGTPSGFGVVHTGSIGFAETHVFDYSGPAGLLIYFDSQIGAEVSAGIDAPLEMQLRSAAGTVVFEGRPSRDVGPLRLPDSGDYRLAVRGGDPWSTGDYRFRLVDVAAEAIPFGLGQEVVGVPDAFSEQFFKFNGRPGQPLFYDALSAAWSFDLTFRGFDPAGQSFLGAGAVAGADSGPFALLHGGVHYLLLRNNSADPVEVPFRWVDLTQPPSEPLAMGETHSGILDPGNLAHFFRVPIAGRSRVYLDGSSDGGDASWSLYAPTLDWAQHGSTAVDAQMDLPSQSGEYILIVSSGFGTDPVSYGIGLHLATVVTHELEPGSTVGGVMAGAESRHCYTFEGSAGQTWYYDALEGDFEPSTVFLIGPGGQTVTAGHSDSDFGPIRLLENGTYTLIQEKPCFDDTSYGFCLIDCASGPLAIADAVVQSTLGGYRAQVYRVEPLAGLGLCFDYLGEDTPAAWWSFHSPRGDLLAGDNLFLGLSSAPTYPGTYWLVISSLSELAVPYAYRMVPANHAPIIDTIGDRVVDEETTFEFSVVARDVESPNDVLTFVLDPGAPSGATLDPVTGVFRWTPAEAQGPGEHVFTVRVRDDGVPSLASAETFTIRVHEVNRPPEPVPIPGPTIHAGGAIRVSIQATDPDVPANTLSFLLLEAPPGARLDPVSGEFNWTSSLTDEGRVYPVQVRVTDNGVPAQSGTSGFGVTVTEPRPVVSVARFEEGITLSWYGIAGHRYLVQTKDRLDATWQDMGGDSLGFGDVITIVDTPVNDRTERYYRVVELP